MKALGIGLQDVSYAWAFVPLLVWTLVAYSRRHAHSKLLERQISGARVELARLRAKGVELRDDALHGFLDPAAYEAWHELAVSWNADVIAAIRKINVADADWFAILDVVPPPRLPMGLFHDDAENKVFAMHDYRLQRLNELIVRMAGTTAG